MDVWISMFVSLVAGALLPIQAGINTQMGRLVGHPLLGSLISFGVGTLGIFAVCLFAGVKFSGFQQVSQAPLWMWVGGLLGAFLVTTSIVVAPKLGATTMVALIVAGQLFSAVILDHFGLVGYVVHTISPARIAGVVLLMIGMVLIQRF